jgi:hypothetical protein
MSNITISTVVKYKPAADMFNSKAVTATATMTTTNAVIAVKYTTDFVVVTLLVLEEGKGTRKQY